MRVSGKTHRELIKVMTLGGVREKRLMGYRTGWQ